MKHYTNIILATLAIVVIAAFIGRAFASPALPPLVDAAQASIRSNQHFIHANQAMVDEFNQRKLNNATQEGIMSTYCYTFDYAKNSAEKIAGCNAFFSVAPSRLAKRGAEPDLSQTQARPTTGLWKLTGSESAPYKVSRLIEYQQMLMARGIHDLTALRLLAGQLMQEEGALNEMAIGDHGCSFGIIQYNACSHNHMSAKRFLSLHPQWKNYKYQLSWMADAVAWRFKQYNGNMKQVIVAHNSPAAAARNEETAAGYFHSVSIQAKNFTL